MKIWQKLGLTVILIFTLLMTPVLAQSNQKEAVVIDGREILQLGSYESVPAEVRTKWLYSQLEEVIKSEEKPRAIVEERNQSPTIRLNERYLLTVTEQDTDSGVTPQRQAFIWAEKIEQAVEQAQQERSKSHIIQRLLLVAFILIVTLVMNWFLGKLWWRSLPFFRRILHLPENDTSSPGAQGLNLILSLTLLALRITLYIAVLIYITNLFLFTRVWSYRIRDRFIDRLSSPLLTIGKNNYSIIDFLVLISLLIGLVFVANTLSNLLRSRVLRLTQINRGIQEVITITAKYTFIFIGSIVILQVWGFDLSSLTILASAVGVAIGFGFQDIAKNFGSGLVLLFERPIKVGDFVEVDKYRGTVEYIGARSTLIRTLDQVSIIVPNSRFLAEEVINWSHQNPISRLHLPVGVSYSADVKLVKSALLEAASQCGEVLSSPPPQVVFLGFGDSALDFELLVWIKEPLLQTIIKSELNFAIEASLKRYNIEIPYPQTDLHLRSGQLPLQLPSDLEKLLRTLLEKHKNN